MIKVYPYQSLGVVDYGWLNAHYHFSFAEYHNPNRMGFGNLRVINDDVIQPGSGFAIHPHRDMEIITYVTQGAISHTDNYGHKGRTEAGDVQIMTAGKGIMHSEYNHESVETKLLQIWIKPNAKNLEPRWQTHKFPKDNTFEKLSLLVSGDGNAPLTINQDAKIYVGNMKKGVLINHKIKENAYLVVVDGAIIVEDESLNKGDGAEITQVSCIKLQALTDCKILLIEI